MYMKIYDNRGERSYSSNKEGKWRYPICKEDISEVEAQQPDDNHKVAKRGRW